MKRYILLAAATLAAGCSSTPEKPPVFSESLITHISDQGNRFFTYKAQLSADQEGGMGGGRRGGRGGGPGGGMGGGPGGGAGGKGGGTMAKMRDNTQEAAMERMEELLAETDYCPNGWFIIEKTFDRGSAEIRGECRAASG
ncbi:hypothetical protein [Microbulbifer thermotolerans]|uniref:Lipoprotein n=1 Tax=Microbulbifer thermotolerans TaxID=252514 RepID=A0A143HJT4_MICTH|nr:hypothetical protein [Microbulbifer thermotolerans]AMX01767.1 hypothetical protein A3224_03475 [Microbulbifer thermotolerans]MCX2779542.1 hypothetical protein [Microbulbifer thermotolerans]MCX2783378.1 hypothetical protein [Microbulbifer thermotolerans]MCX2793414.1 hypothetical protein [Microbulbifer thermotolerans]MCX2801355.1 hypothetical protein [Microbulbifer thermotolerans]